MYSVFLKQNLVFQWLKQCSTPQTTPQVGSTVNVSNKTTEQMKKVLMCNGLATTVRNVNRLLRFKGEEGLHFLKGMEAKKLGTVVPLPGGGGSIYFYKVIPNCQAAKDNLKTIGIPTLSYEKVLNSPLPANTIPTEKLWAHHPQKKEAEAWIELQNGASTKL